MEIDKLLVKDLKAKLKDLGLPVTGRKAELVERLKEALAADAAVGEDVEGADVADKPVSGSGAGSEDEERGTAEPHNDTQTTAPAEKQESPAVENSALANDAAAANDGATKHGAGAQSEPETAASPAPAPGATDAPAEATASPTDDASGAAKHAQQPSSAAANGTEATAQQSAGADDAMASSDEALSMGSDDEEPAPAAPVVSSKPAPRQSKEPAERSQRKRRSPPGGVHRDGPADAQVDVNRRTAAVAPGDKEKTARNDDVRTAPKRGRASPQPERPRRGATPEASTRAARGAPNGGRDGRREANAPPTPNGAAKRRHAAIVFDAQGAAVAAAAAPAAKVVRKEVQVQPADGATEALRIDGFRRPLREAELKTLLAETGTLEGFWMDSIKSHCYVVFSSIKQAQATHKASFKREWPPRCNSIMMPKYVTVQEARAIIDANGNVILRTGSAQSRPSSAEDVAPHANADTAPLDLAADDTMDVDHAEPPTAVSPADEAGKADAAGGVRGAAKEEELGDARDFFKLTEAKPHIYWVPLPEEEVEARRAAEAAKKEADQKEAERRAAEAAARKAEEDAKRAAAEAAAPRGRSGSRSRSRSSSRSRSASGGKGRGRSPSGSASPGQRRSGSRQPRKRSADDERSDRPDGTDDALPQPPRGGGSARHSPDPPARQRSSSPPARGGSAQRKASPRDRKARSAEASPPPPPQQARKPRGSVSPSPPPAR